MDGWMDRRWRIGDWMSRSRQKEGGQVSACVWEEENRRRGEERGGLICACVKEGKEQKEKEGKEID